MRHILRSFLLLLVPVFAHGSVLSDTAGSMAPGEWKQLNTTGFVAAALPLATGSNILLDTRYDGGDRMSVFNYSNRAIWDNTRLVTPYNRVFYLGSSHNGNGAYIEYNENTNAWSLVETGYNYGTQTYNHVTQDTRTGVIWRGVPQYVDSVYKRTNVSPYWTIATRKPHNNTASGIVYHPYLGIQGSLLDFNGKGGTATGVVARYDIASGVWTTLASGLAMGPYHNTAIYDPVKRLAVGGGGNDDRHLYSVDSSGNVTALSLAPHDQAVWHNVLSGVDPVTGKIWYWTTDGTGGSVKSVHTLEPTGSGTWTDRGVTSSHPFDLAGQANTYGSTDVEVHNVVTATIFDYGVILFMAYSNGYPEVPPQIWLFKPTAVPPPPPAKYPTIPTGIKVD